MTWLADTSEQDLDSALFFHPASMAGSNSVQRGIVLFTTTGVLPRRQGRRPAFRTDPPDR
jgi:hypothetical protein